MDRLHQSGSAPEIPGRRVIIMGETVFSVLGPIMVGPSSSHTAGVARLGQIARNILGKKPNRAEITFLGSFATTYKGHGSDRAVIGGLLDMDSADARIPRALEIAAEEGLSYKIRTIDQAAGHPNSLEIALWNGEEKVELLGSSRGGGNILVEKINGFDVHLDGKYPSLWILHYDRPGMVGKIASLLAEKQINIAYMRLERSQPRGLASMTIECDDPLEKELIEEIRQKEFVQSCRYIPRVR